MSVRVKNHQTEPKKKFHFILPKDTFGWVVFKMHVQKVLQFLFCSKFAKVEKNRLQSVFSDFISKNIGMFRESLCSTKKSYGIEILSVHFFVTLCFQRCNILWNVLDLS